MSTMYSRVREVKAGEQITKPGIYKIPIERYHNDPDLFPGHSVSSTGLRRMNSTCPRMYWAHSVHNPERIPGKASEALRFGKAVHSYLLEKGLPKDDFALCPFKDWVSNEGNKSVYEIRQEMKGDDGQLVLGDDGQPQMETFKGKGWMDDNGNIYKNYLEYKKVWRSMVEWSGRTIVYDKDIKIFKAMAAELAKNPLIADGLLDGLVEHSICWPDPETGIWIKIRPDVIPGAVMLGDYKTGRSAHPREISRSIPDYGYDQQLALCMEGIARVLGRRIDSTFLVVQEKTEPYIATVAPVNDDTLWWGARMNRKALNDIKRCLDAGEWPGYGDGAPVTVGNPEWRRKQLLSYQEMFEDDPDLRYPDIKNLSEIVGEL